MRRLTHKQVIHEVRQMGLTCTRNSYGEFRVNFRDGDEDTAYYTTDGDDAINTAAFMAAERREHDGR